jgi:hypothetical protein
MSKVELDPVLAKAIQDSPTLTLKNGIIRNKQLPIHELKKMGITEDKAMPFKLQRPLFTMEPHPMVMAYNQKKSWLGEFEMTPFYRTLFGEDFKIYVQAAPHKKLGLVLFHILPDQDW